VNDKRHLGLPVQPTNKMPKSQTEKFRVSEPKKGANVKIDGQNHIGLLPHKRNYSL